MDAAPALDRIAGCLVGQCLGDALGFAVEGCGPEECAFYVNELLRAGKAGRMGRPPFPFGQYTDDSQLARELLRSLAERGGFDGPDYAARVAALFAEGRVVGRGQATAEAAARLSTGVPWDQAGTPAPSAGNGGAMRAAPIGVWFSSDLALASSAASLQASVTHQDPRARAGASAIAVATALAIRDDAPLHMGTVAAHVGSEHAGLAAAIEGLGAWAATASLDEAYERVRRHARDLGEEPIGWRGVSPFVVPSVLWSLYAVLRHPGSYWDAVCAAIEVGGDVDTTAAMAGAIAGARLGLRALPSELTAQLTDRGTWGLAELLSLARAARESLSSPGR
jgi:ADP-ribosylglycohydrolase